MFGFLFAIWLALLSCSHTVVAYIEPVTVSGCESCKLSLTCRHFSSIIAILEAEFTPEANETAANDTLVPSAAAFPPIHPRQALNKRCSGVNHCSFILTEDCPGAGTWGGGNLTVKYVCVSEDQIKKFCNSEIVLPDNNNNNQAGGAVSEGFIHNPGYPRFYTTERECRWKIKVPDQQRIRLTVLDISVIGSTASIGNKRSDSIGEKITFFDNTVTNFFMDDCDDDRLDIIESGQIIETTCKPQEPPLEIVSDTEVVEVVLYSARSLTPLRGVLVHFTAVGCPTPVAPEDGYLVYRNETVAEYRCCVGFAFPDDGRRTRVITCSGATWDATLPLPNCQKKVLPPVQESRKPHKSNMTSDILAPALLIAALFLINFMVLFYIYKIRQKHAIEFADEELGTLALANQEKTSP